MATSTHVRRSTALRAALMVLLWVGLTGTDPRAWLVGVPVVLLATAASAALAPASSWHIAPRGVLPFLWFSGSQSIRGGIDVARRALSPSCPLDPGFVSFVPRMPPSTARLFFCNSVNLLPGTCVVEMQDHQVVIHVLDRSTQIEAELRALEDRVAGLFGLDLPPRQEAAS